MKKCFLLIFFLTTSPIFTQWKQQMTPDHAIYDVEFINLKTGWACGDNIIYKTTNGGTNWVTQSNPAISTIFQIIPVDSNILYAVGYWTILKTTNGGTNWQGIRAGGPFSGYAILDGGYFLNENTGWLCGNVTIMKTTNGCQSFDSMRVEGVMKDIYFKDSLNGVMCGEGKIFYTTNGGINWLESGKSQWGSHFFRMKFINDFTGWTIDLRSYCYKTTNFGVSWDSISSLPWHFSTPGGYGIDFLDSNLGFVAADGGIFKTTNGGINWRREQTSQFGSGIIYYDLNILTDSIVYAGGYMRFLYTNSGGQVGISNISSTLKNNFILSQNYPNPFNPSSIINYQLTINSFVILNVYDINGRLVKELVNKKQNAGSYSIDFDGSGLPSGTYIYRLQAGDFSETKKMVLLK